VKPLRAEPRLGLKRAYWWRLVALWLMLVVMVFVPSGFHDPSRNPLSLVIAAVALLSMAGLTGALLFSHAARVRLLDPRASMQAQRSYVALLFVASLATGVAVLVKALP
jgi:hypothetical protein